MRNSILLLAILLMRPACQAQADAAATSSSEDSLLALISAVDDDSLRMQWYNQLRRLVIYENPQKALVYCREYGAYAQKAKMPQEYAKSKFYEANSYVPLGQYELALASLFEAEVQFQRVGEHLKLGSVYNSIGAVFEATARDSLAVIYFQKAYEVFTEANDEARQSMTLNNLSNIYYRLENFEESKRLLEQAISLTRTKEDLYRRKLNYANTLVALRDHDRAFVIYHEFLDQPDPLDIYTLCLVHTGIGKLYQQTGETVLAVRHLSNALEMASRQQFVENRLDILQHLARSYEAMGEYQPALAYLQTYYNLKDSLLSSDKDKNLVEALTKYETEKKESEIVLLQKDKALASRNQQILLLIGMILLLIAGVSLMLYRNRQRSLHMLQEKNRTITKMLEEKEFLVKEIHHRVKNNLQVISSLLQLQSRYVEEPGALAALNEGESRVRSMSIIHHHLYTGDNLSQVNVPRYLESLCNSLLASYNYKKQQITIHQHIDNASLDVSMMIPLGLIINELLTNAFKYAFEGRESGQIWVQLHVRGSDLHVSVRDDGVGRMSNETGGTGFGTRLIGTFLRKLEATAETLQDQGTEVRILIPQYRREAVRNKTA